MTPRARLACHLGLLLGLLWLAPGSADAGEVSFSGVLESNLQVGSECNVIDGCQLADYRNRNFVGFRVEATPSPRVQVNANVLLRNLNYSESSSLEEMGTSEPVQPFDIRFEDVSVSLYDVGLAGFDFKVGVQRIAWGVAYGINPVDRVNPYDFEDPTRLEARLSSPAVRATYTRGDLAIEAVGLPFFIPAALPLGARDADTLFGDSEWFPFDEARSDGEPNVGRITTEVARPETTLRNMQGGARIVWTGPVGHLGLSYFHGIDSLPQANGDASIIGFQGIDRVDFRIPLEHPRLQILGAEWRRPLGGGVSAWVEAAVLFPERTVVRFSPGQLQQLVDLSLIDQVPDPIPQEVTQTSKPYVNAVAGVEYESDALYANLQYSYGFPTERSAGEQHHYGWLVARVPILPEFRLTARAGIELNDSFRALAWVGGAGATYVFDDAVDCEIGTLVRKARQASSLRNLGAVPILRLRLAVRF